MTEMDITYVFTRYISVTIQRQAKTFYRRNNRITYYENKELIENINIEREMLDSSPELAKSYFDNFEENLTYQEILSKGLGALSEIEKYIICEKFLNKRSDADIGSEFSISSQMISKRKRKILGKLKNFFLV